MSLFTGASGDSGPTLVALTFQCSDYKNSQDLWKWGEASSDFQWHTLVPSCGTEQTLLGVGYSLAILSKLQSRTGSSLG